MTNCGQLQFNVENAEADRLGRTPRRSTVKDSDISALMFPSGTLKVWSKPVLNTKDRLSSNYRDVFIGLVVGKTRLSRHISSNRIIHLYHGFCKCCFGNRI